MIALAPRDLSSSQFSNLRLANDTFNTFLDLHSNRQRPEKTSFEKDCSLDGKDTSFCIGTRKRDLSVRFGVDTVVETCTRGFGTDRKVLSDSDRAISD